MDPIPCLDRGVIGFTCKIFYPDDPYKWNLLVNSIRDKNIWTCGSMSCANIGQVVEEQRYVGSMIN